MDHNVDLEVIAGLCNGYVGADLKALCREAARFAQRRGSNVGMGENGILLTVEDWDCARSEVGASITRGASKEVSKVSWDDIGGLKSLKVSFVFASFSLHNNYPFPCKFNFTIVNRKNSSRLLSGL